MAKALLTRRTRRMASQKHSAAVSAIDSVTAAIAPHAPSRGMSAIIVPMTSASNAPAMHTSPMKMNSAMARACRPAKPMRLRWNSNSLSTSARPSE
ncbi:MAG: hypothetical protein R3E02_04990 [Blastomonas sp.]